MVRLSKCILLVGIPLIFSVLAVLKNSIFMFLAYIVVHFIIMKFIPVFKSYENIGMFVLVAFSSIPINIYIVKLLLNMILLVEIAPFISALKGILYYMVVLSIEEVIMGILTRVIWKNQDC